MFSLSIHVHSHHIDCVGLYRPSFHLLCRPPDDKILHVLKNYRGLRRHIAHAEAFYGYQMNVQRNKTDDHTI